MIDNQTARADSEPLVSIIMIFFQAERFIAEAIDSVLAQTYSNWELLLVDDGSTDDGTRLALDFVARYPGQLRYFDHPGHANLGTAASRNLGLAKSRGRYLAFLDADDSYLPARIARHVRVMEEHPDVGVVIGSELYWFSWGDVSRDGAQAQADYVLGPGVTPDLIMDPPELLALVVAPDRAATPAICSITFRDLAIDEMDGVPEYFTGQYEDQCLIAKLLLKHRAIVVNECLARYRQHEASLTATARRRGEYGPRQASVAEETYLRWLTSYVSRQGVTSPLLDRALRRRLRPYDHPWLDGVCSLPKTIVRRATGALVTVVASLIPGATRGQLLEHVRNWRWWWRQKRIRHAEAMAARGRPRP